MKAVIMAGGLGSAEAAVSQQADSGDFRTADKAYVGGLLGASSLDHNFGTGIGFGLDGAYYVDPNWGVGALLRSANHDNNVASSALSGTFAGIGASLKLKSRQSSKSA